MSTAELEAIIEKLAERLKNLERTINRVEGQIADLYSRVRR
jgi:prefoldin subunit 5